MRTVHRAGAPPCTPRRATVHRVRTRRRRRRVGLTTYHDRKDEDTRKTFTIGIVVVLFGAPALASAADKCPAELAQAKSMLNKAAASAKTSTTAPRQLAGARTQDVQAPRTAAQDVQAPRTASQDVQAPRTGAQDVQAPRTASQDVQAPRTASQDVQAPRTASQDV